MVFGNLSSSPISRYGKWIFHLFTLQKLLDSSGFLEDLMHFETEIRLRRKNFDHCIKYLKNFNSYLPPYYIFIRPCRRTWTSGAKTVEFGCSKLKICENTRKRSWMLSVICSLIGVGLKHVWYHGVPQWCTFWYTRQKFCRPDYFARAFHRTELTFVTWYYLFIIICILHIRHITLH